MNASVTVWTMQVGAPSEAALARWQSVLDQKETAQAARFRFDKDRHTYIAAHALLRALLENLGGRPAASWQFVESDKGKPYIEPQTGLQFSLSHTNGLVVCAAANGFSVGIDTESLDRRTTQDDLAQTVLAASELAIVNAAPSSQRQAMFLKFWTLREAYVKATGQGIGFPREDFAFTLEPLRIHFTDEAGAADWHLSSWDEGRHIVSLAAAAPMTLSKRVLTEGELL